MAKLALLIVSSLLYSGGFWFCRPSAAHAGDGRGEDIDGLAVDVTDEYTVVLTSAAVGGTMSGNEAVTKRWLPLHRPGARSGNIVNKPNR